MHCNSENLPNSLHVVDHLVEWTAAHSQSNWVHDMTGNGRDMMATWPSVLEFIICMYIGYE